MRNGALESSTNARVKTLGSSPRGSTDTKELLMLVTLERLGSLLHNLHFRKRSNLGHIELYSILFYCQRRLIFFPVAFRKTNQIEIQLLFFITG